MSLDERLREGLGRMAADFPPEPVDLGADLQGVLAAGHRRRVMRRASVAFVAVALLVIAFFAGPGSVRQVGIQKLKTADNPPSETGRNESLGTTGEDSKGGGVAPRGGGSEQGAAGGQTRDAEAPRTGPTAAAAGGSSGAHPTPKAAGTYSYTASGQNCGSFGCGYPEEVTTTHDRADGSRQRSTSKWVNTDGGRFEDESVQDYRTDGVYLENYRYTYINKYGVAESAWACPDLQAVPVRVWPAGAKPGDHFEYTVPCGAYDPNSQETTSVDILRSETISVGGKDVSTFVVHEEIRAPQSSNVRITDAWVTPDHLLWVKEQTSWRKDYGSGDYSLMLNSMSPR